ncbi:MAG: restriction endonuclease, partial [Pseudanabaena sp.]
MNQLANIPRPVALFIPTLQALKNLGGSGSIDEITSEILRMLNLSDEVLNVLHGNTSQGELAY